MKYTWQYPSDVERAMDAFAADNPNATWREFQRAFEQAMLRSMKEGGDLFKRFDPHDERRQ
jgi:hypothetical protein